MDRRSVEPFQHEGAWLWRAHVWTLHGYSSKTFTNQNEAASWKPKK